MDGRLFVTPRPQSWPWGWGVAAPGAAGPTWSGTQSTPFSRNQVPRATRCAGSGQYTQAMRRAPRSASHRPPRTGCPTASPARPAAWKACARSFESHCVVVDCLNSEGGTGFSTAYLESTLDLIDSDHPRYRPTASV